LSFRFVHPVEVRFRDLDAFGHVNNVVYLTYMESARLAYWAHVTGRRDWRQLEMILARTEIDYRAPAGLDERLQVGVRCVSMRRSSFVLEFEVSEVGTGRVVAEARKVLVHYDYAAGQPKPLTDEMRKQLLAQDPDAEQE
jgi:acyl-CoA thioester hydrolase